MNPARDFDDAKLESMANDPAGSTGWPSRYGRCFAAEVLILRRQLRDAQAKLSRYAINELHQMDQELKL